MNQTIKIIDEITKYGLTPFVNSQNKERDLEENLVKLYSKYFQIAYEFDERDYPDFKKEQLPNIIENVSRNFPSYGLYHTVLNSDELNEAPENAVGDAIDDLADIIIDLLEIKWRFENNSDQDALWFFKMIFESHTQQHLISLLNFMNRKKCQMELPNSKGYTLVEPNIYTELHADQDLLLSCLAHICKYIPEILGLTQDKHEVVIIQVESPHGPPYPAIGIHSPGEALAEIPDDCQDRLDEWVNRIGVEKIKLEAAAVKTISWEELSRIGTFLVA